MQNPFKERKIGNSSPDPSQVVGYPGCRERFYLEGKTKAMPSRPFSDTRDKQQPSTGRLRNSSEEALRDPN